MRKFLRKKEAKSKLSRAQWEPRNCLFIQLVPDVLDKNNGQEEIMNYVYIFCNLFFYLIIQISQHVCYNIWISWEKGGDGIWEFQFGIHNGSGMTGITKLCTIIDYYQIMYNLIDNLSYIILFEEYIAMIGSVGLFPVVGGKVN